MVGILIVLSLLVGAVVSQHIAWVIAAIIYILVVTLLLD